MKPVMTEITPGMWYDVDLVTRVQVYDEVPETLGFFGRILRPREPWVVRIFFLGGSYEDFSVDDKDAALSLARQVAATVNATRKNPEVPATASVTGE